jgi:hypothetical protein
MIGFIVDQILGPFWPYIAGAAVLVAGWFAAKRQGAQGAKAKRDVADAKETIKAHEVRDDVEDRIDRGGSAKQRLRERWRKP